MFTCSHVPICTWTYINTWTHTDVVWIYLFNSFCGTSPRVVVWHGICELIRKNKKHVHILGGLEQDQACLYLPGAVGHHYKSLNTSKTCRRWHLNNSWLYWQETQLFLAVLIYSKESVGHWSHSIPKNCPFLNYWQCACCPNRRGSIKQKYLLKLAKT